MNNKKYLSILENNYDEILKRYIQKWQLPEIMISSLNQISHWNFKLKIKLK